MTNKPLTYKPTVQLKKGDLAALPLISLTSADHEQELIEIRFRKNKLNGLLSSIDAVKISAFDEILRVYKNCATASPNMQSLCSTCTVKIIAINQSARTTLERLQKQIEALNN